MHIDKKRIIGNCNPLVSVIIPAYNAAQYIGEAIESALAQTYKNQEIIVVDDGSNDNTVELISNKYGEKVTIIKQKNAGPSSARNRGIKEARGEYIAFLDADDIWLPNKISEQIELMEKYLDVGMVFGNATTLKDGRKSELSHFEKEGLDEAYFGDRIYYKDAFKKLFNKNIIMTQTVMMRTSIIEKTGGFDTDFRFAEDFLLWLNIARVTKIAYQPQVVAFRRRHDGNLTNDLEKPVFNRPGLYQKLMETHGDLLAEAGVDIQSKIANAWFQLGHYKLYNQGETDVSKYFAKSLKTKPTLRCALNLLISKLGLCSSAVRIRQIIKQKTRKNQ
jgi:glycosyltransferase involved in cell wall biosynthesis